MSFTWTLCFALSALGTVFSFFYLYSQHPEKKRQNVSVLGAIFLFLLLFALIGMATSMPSRGSAITSLSQGVTYTTEWVRVNGPVVSMKLNLGEKSLSLYYEIDAKKLPMWDGKLESFPAKFRVLTDKTREFYALKPVE